MFWGFSEAINLYEEYTKAFESEPEEINVLLYGTCDPRNILETIAKSYTHKSKINFYLVDGCIEIVARNMLLILLALEQSETLTLRNKIHLYMDIFGNSLLRPTSTNYMASKSKVIRNIITDEDYMKKIVPIFNIENLKYRERDGLENTLHFWLPKDEHNFDIGKFWELRNRQKLGTRYDCRDGVFDWDLQMNLKDNGAQQIASQEYRFWRETGIAFTFPEYEQCRPNKTLAAGLTRNGTRYTHRGYLGDFAIGPFCAFGLTTNEKKMTEEFHGQYKYRATDVTERNLYEIFYEIEEKSEYIHDEKNSHKLGGNVMLLNTPLPSGSDQELLNLKKYDKPILPLNNVTINFLSTDDLLDLQEQRKFKKHFDVVFVAFNYFVLLKKGFAETFKNKCLIIFETNLYTLSKKEERSEFLEKLKNYAKDLQLKNVTNFNINLNYSVVKYKNEI